MPLRPYQAQVIVDIKEAMRRGHKSVLLQMPTGAGKTVVFCDIVKTASSRGKRVYILVHRQELLEQASQKLIENRVPHGLLTAGGVMNEQRVQICSIPTLARRLEKVPAPDFLVWDESAHLPSKSWASIFAKYSRAYHVGVTATPERLSGEPLGDFFTCMVQGPSVKKLTEMGYLAPLRHFAKEFDAHDVKVTAGDFNRGALAEKMAHSKITGDLVREYREKANGKKMLVFAPTIDFGEKLVKKMGEDGISSVMLDGMTEKGQRAHTLKMFREGKIQSIVNVELFTEGTDIPDLEVVALLRPTQSLALYLQMVGRVARIAPGKKEGVILDLAGNFFRHGFYDDHRDWTLKGKKEEPKGERIPSVKTCDSCFAALPPATKTCPYCGSVSLKKQRVIRTEKGRLAEIKREEREQKEKEKQRARRERSKNMKKLHTKEDVVAYGKEMGYHWRWAEHYCRVKGII